MNAALRLDPENQKIQLKIRQLTDMLNNRMQGNQLSPTEAGQSEAADKFLPAPSQRTGDEKTDPQLSESQQLIKATMVPDISH